MEHVPLTAEERDNLRLMLVARTHHQYSLHLFRTRILRLLADLEAAETKVRELETARFTNDDLGAIRELFGRLGVQRITEMPGAVIEL